MKDDKDGKEVEAYIVQRYLHQHIYNHNNMFIVFREEV
jgi:hypothetical protein